MTSSQPRHTLLTLCGTSPAVITETIWALAMEAIDQPSLANLPDRVIVLTTTVGKQCIIEELLTPFPDAPCLWIQLQTTLNEIGFNVTGKLKFGNANEYLRTFSTECPKSGLSIALDDLRSPRDQEEAADYMLETIRAITEAPDEQLTLSIAGGRKSMSALLYGAMTLLGREEDRVTHVLVSPPYDSPALKPKFYFPQQLTNTLQTHDKRAIKATDAIIELADIPFVPLRYVFEKHFQTAPPTFRGLAANYTAQSLLHKAPPFLCINTETGIAHFNDERVALSPTEFLIIFFFADRANKGAPPFPDYKSAVDELALFMSHQSDHTMHPKEEIWRQKIISQIVDSDSLNKKISALRSKLRKTDKNYDSLINHFPKKGDCSLSYPSERIIIS